MYQLNRVKISGFRRLNEVELPVRPFMALIGANGVGKTSLLDAFSILSASASGNLNGTLSRYGGISSILTRGKSEDISFMVDMDVPGHKPLEYEISLSQRASGYVISREILSQERDGYRQPFKHIDSTDSDIRYYEIDSNRLVRPDWEHNSLETSLAQVPKMFRQPEELRTYSRNRDPVSRSRCRSPRPRQIASSHEAGDIARSGGGRLGAIFVLPSGN